MKKYYAFCLKHNHPNFIWYFKTAKLDTELYIKWTEVSHNIFDASMFDSMEDAVTHYNNHLYFNDEGEFLKYFHIIEVQVATSIVK